MKKFKFVSYQEESYCSQDIKVSLFQTDHLSCILRHFVRFLTDSGYSERNIEDAIINKYFKRG